MWQRWVTCSLVILGLSGLAGCPEATPPVDEPQTEDIAPTNDQAGGDVTPTPTDTSDPGTTTTPRPTVPPLQLDPNYLPSGGREWPNPPAYLQQLFDRTPADAGQATTGLQYVLTTMAAGSTAANDYAPADPPTTDAPTELPGTPGAELSVQTWEDSVNYAVTHVIEATTALGMLNPLGDARLDLTPLSYAYFGTCPEVATLVGDTGMAITMDYGDNGCTGPNTGGHLVAGLEGFVYFRDNSQEGWFDFFQLSIDGQLAVGGLRNLRFVWNQTPLVFAGDADFTTTLGSIHGAVTLGLDADGPMGLIASQLSLCDATACLDAAVNVTVNPRLVANFVPPSGSVVFAGVDPNGDPATITVQFSVQSPVDGTVTVSFDGSVPQPYTVPGIAP